MAALAQCVYTLPTTAILTAATGKAQSPTVGLLLAVRHPMLGDHHLGFGPSKEQPSVQKLMKKRKGYLITGSSGFVGTHLCDILNRGGQRYSAIPHSNLLNPGPEERRLLQDCDAIIYLAGLAHRMDLQEGRHAHLYTQANAISPGTIARIAREAGVSRFIFVSTVKVHGETSAQDGFRPADSMAPEGIYAESKALGEMHLASVLAESSTRLIVVRPPLVYGAGVRGNLQRLMKLVNKGWPLPLGACGGIRSLISASNLAEFLLHLAVCSEQDLASGLVRLNPSIVSIQREYSYYAFLPSDLDISTSDLLRRLIVLMGSQTWLMPVPSLVFRPTSLYTRLVASLKVDSSAARATGWKNRVTSDQALQEMVQSFLFSNAGSA